MQIRAIDLQVREDGMVSKAKHRPGIGKGTLLRLHRADQTVLRDQDYIREDSKSVADLVGEVAAKVGENVVVRRFARFRLGEEA